MSAHFSRRSDFARQTNAWELARSAALRTGRSLLDLTESNPTRAKLPALPAAIAALAHPDAVHYRPEPLGMRSAREAISALMRAHGPEVKPERIVLTASTSEAYAFLFKLLCDAGDDVLVPAPSYPLFEHLLALEAVRAASYPLAYDGRWHLQANALSSARGERTRALVVVHPNNPTGSYLKRDELMQLARLGLPIVSDEVFAPYPLCDDPERVQSAREAQAALVFSLHGLSKLAGLPQLKLGWICVGGPDALADEACARLTLIADSYLSVSTPVQLALPAILAAHGELADAIRERLRGNLECVRGETAESPVTLLHVEGGWYAVLHLPGVLDDEGWALELLRASDVLVQPGYFYDFVGGPYVVVSLLTEGGVLREGVRRLVARVEAVSRG